MKKIQLNAAKLQLNKDRIANLTNSQMGKVHGGENGLTNDGTVETDGDTDIHFMSINCSVDKSCAKIARNGTCCDRRMSQDCPNG